MSNVLLQTQSMTKIDKVLGLLPDPHDEAIAVMHALGCLREKSWLHMHGGWAA